MTPNIDFLSTRTSFYRYNSIMYNLSLWIFFNIFCCHHQWNLTYRSSCNPRRTGTDQGRSLVVRLGSGSWIFQIILGKTRIRITPDTSVSQEFSFTRSRQHHENDERHRWKSVGGPTVFMIERSIGWSTQPIPRPEATGGVDTIAGGSSRVARIFPDERLMEETGNGKSAAPCQLALGGLEDPKSVEKRMARRGFSWDPRDDSRGVADRFQRDFWLVHGRSHPYRDEVPTKVTTASLGRASERDVVLRRWSVMRLSERTSEEGVTAEGVA